MRVKVENTGEMLALACRAYLIKTESLNDDSQAEPTLYADSLPLQWSCQPTRSPIDLPRGVSQYVDLVASGIDRTLPDHSYYWKMCFAVPQPVRYNDLFSGRPKKLRFTIQVSGDGVAPEQLNIDVRIGDDWNDVTASCVT